MKMNRITTAKTVLERNFIPSGNILEKKKGK